MAGNGGAPQRADGPPEGAASLEDIEQDLDTVDEALAALDSEDLDEAEALAAGLVASDQVSAPSARDDHR